MYFKNFPKTTYSLTGYENIEVLDIMKRVQFNFDSAFSNRPYEYYTVEEGDTADIIAEKHYGSSEWWWLVLLFNNVTNPFIEKHNEKADKDHLVITDFGDSSEFSNPGPYYGGGGRFESQSSSTYVEKYFYVERDGGDDEVDFRTGDIIILLSSSETVSSLRGSVQYTSPAAIVDKNTRGAVKVINFNPALREASVRGEYTGRFSVGDKVGVLQEGTNLGESARLKVWGTIKRLSNRANKLYGFIKNDTGREVSPLWQHQTNTTADRITPINTKGSSVPSYEKTLIGGFLGLTGAAGSTYASEYTPILYSERNISEKPVRRIKLLHDSFKFQAQTLFKKAIKTNTRGDTLVYSRLNSSRNNRIGY